MSCDRSCDLLSVSHSRKFATIRRWLRYYCSCTAQTRRYSDVLSRSQTIDNVGQLLWAWFSFLRKSADEIVEPWHRSLLTSRTALHSGTLGDFLVENGTCFTWTIKSDDIGGRQIRPIFARQTTDFCWPILLAYEIGELYRSSDISFRPTYFPTADCIDTWLTV